MSVRPKKELGQHFLVDENILADDVVLEVGPGLGVLTRYLAARVAHVHAVELDQSLEPQLQGIERTTLHWQDALALDPAALEPPPTKLVANLPYNIATPLVVESLDRAPTVGSWCVMVQREVADRFFARPGTKAYGAVSVLVQLVTERTGFHAVSRQVFRPRPNVDSALVAFGRREKAVPPGVKPVVEAAFGQVAAVHAGVLADEPVQQLLVPGPGDLVPARDQLGGHAGGRVDVPDQRRDHEQEPCH